MWQILCFAKMQYNSNHAVLVDMMATLFKSITGMDFLGASSSWETVGVCVCTRGGGIRACRIPAATAHRIVHSLILFLGCSRACAVPCCARACQGFNAWTLPLIYVVRGCWALYKC